LRHISALASTSFRYAVVEQRLGSSRWKDVVFPEDAVDAPSTPHYNWEDAQDIISALVDHADCQLIMALACFLGLWPNEIAPLRWEDFDGDWLQIRRGYVRGKLDVPKTPESVAAVPVILQVRIPLA
jgi:integrase